MSALEQQILDLFHRLDQTAQVRLLEKLQQETQSESENPAAALNTLPLTEWLEKATALREDLRDHYGIGTTHHVNIQAIIDEIREE